MVTARNCLGRGALSLLTISVWQFGWMICGAALVGCSGGIVLGWVVGIKACARSTHCVRLQRDEVQDWTGELTKRMEARLKACEKSAATQERSRAKPDEKGHR